MKQKLSLITIESGHHDIVLDKIIEKRHAELKEMAEQNAVFFAKRNQPRATGDKLADFIGTYKAGYEKLGAEIAQFLQPSRHFPDARMEADYYKEKDGILDAEIGKQEHENNLDMRLLGNYNPKPITRKIKWALILSSIIMLGDTLFNTKSFLAMAENLLFALFLSICISIAVLTFSHMTAFRIKETKTILKKRVITLTALAIAAIVFAALAVFRSKYLEIHDVHISPIYFVIINLFFFIVSTLLSYSLLPSWQETKENAKKQKLQDAVDKRNVKIQQLQDEKEKIRAAIVDANKNRRLIVYGATYSNDLIKKCNYETAETFKSTNLLHRSDGLTPDCYSDPIAEPDMEDIRVLLNPNRKAS